MSKVNIGLFKADLKELSIRAFLVIALFFSTATRLRYPSLPVGISDAFFLLFAITSFFQGRLEWRSSKSFYFLASFFSLLVLSNLGAVLHSFQNNSLYSYLYDNFSLLYIMTLTWIFLTYKESLEEVVESLIIFKVWVAVIFSFFNVWEMLGLPTPERFSFLSLNPNQIALFLVPAPFLILHFLMDSYKNAESFSKHKIKIISFILCFFLALLIRSFALLLAWGLLFTFMGIYYVKRRMNKVIWYTLAVTIPLFLITLGVWLFFSIEQLKELPIYTYNSLIVYIWNIPQEFYIRWEIWGNIITAIMKDGWLLGYGPGALIAVSPEHNLPLQEAHNIFLGITYQGGVLALLGIIAGIYILAKKTLVIGQYFLFLALLSLIIFSFFHGPIRMPIFWFYLAYIYKSKKGGKGKIS